MCTKAMFITGAAIMMGMGVVMLFPVMGNPDTSSAPVPPVLDEVLNKPDNIPAAWSQKLPAARRFVLVLDGEAVLDKETGLVWEKLVSALSSNWFNAVVACLNLEVGGRKGWHLPTIEQLASLVDTSVDEPPKLSAGHPFEGVQPLGYWSATTDGIDATFARSVGFNTGRVLRHYKTGDNLVWCVRGGQGRDGQ